MENKHSSFAGENSACNKISEQQAIMIIHLLEKDPRSMAALSRDYSISLYIIEDINKCRTWKYLHNYTKNIRKEYSLRGNVKNEDDTNSISGQSS